MHIIRKIKFIAINLSTAAILTSCVSFNDAVEQGATAVIDVPGILDNLGEKGSTINLENLESGIEEILSTLDMDNIIESLSVEESEKQTDSEALAANKPSPLSTATKTDFDFQIHFLDMGQADSTIILSGDECLVFDAGARDFEDNTICNYLTALGVDNVDYLILSHWDIDHYMQADEILNTFDVKNVMYSSQFSTNTTVKTDISLIEKEGCKILEPIPGNQYTLGNADFTVIGPRKAEYEDINDSSIGIIVNFGTKKFLFTGDAESEGEKDILSNCDELGINLKNCSVYQAGHHGSNTSSSDEFINIISPEYCVISCGIGNEYYHPHKTTLDKLKKNKTKIYRTDEQGSIVCSSDGLNLYWNLSPSTTMQPGNGPED